MVAWWPPLHRMRIWAPFSMCHIAGLYRVLPEKIVSIKPTTTQILLYPGYCFASHVFIAGKVIITTQILLFPGYYFASHVFIAGGQYWWRSDRASDVPPPPPRRHRRKDVYTLAIALSTP